MGQVDNQTNEKTGGEKTVFGVLDEYLPPGFWFENKTDVGVVKLKYKLYEPCHYLTVSTLTISSNICKLSQGLSLSHL